METPADAETTADAETIADANTIAEGNASQMPSQLSTSLQAQAPIKYADTI